MRLEVDDASMSEEDWLSVGLSAIVCLVCLVVVPFRIKEEKGKCRSLGQNLEKFFSAIPTQFARKRNAIG